MKYIALIYLSSVLSINAFADRVGNGGDAVVCFKNLETKQSVQAVLKANRDESAFYQDPFANPNHLNDIEKVELLDLYFRRKPLIETDETDYRKVIEERFEVIRGKSKFYKHLNNVRKKILPIGEWIEAHHGILEIDDSDVPQILPPKCLLMQVAYQEMFGDDSKVMTYDVRLFERLSPVHQAALAFHEWNCHLLKCAVAGTTRKSQFLTALFFQRDFAQEHPRSLFLTLDDLGLWNFDIRYYDERAVQGAELVGWFYEVPGSRGIETNINLVNPAEVLISGKRNTIQAGSLVYLNQTRWGEKVDYISRIIFRSPHVINGVSYPAGHWIFLGQDESMSYLPH